MRQRDRGKTGYFNPRSREGSDRQTGVDQWQRNEFQSTLP